MSTCDNPLRCKLQTANCKLHERNECQLPTANCKLQTFSLIVPVFNGEKYLRECLDSIRAQTWTAWEAVCVDDGSTDSSGAILDEYAAMDGRFKIVHQPNRGVSAARNAALEKISCEWFGFVDCDDAIAPDTLSDLAGLIERHRPDSIQINKLRTSDISTAAPAKMISPCVAPLDLLFGETRGSALTVAKYFSRSRFGHLRFIAGMKLREDLVYWLDALCVKDARWMVVEKPFYFYRRHNESASFNVNAAGAVDLLKLAALAIPRLRAIGASEELVEEFRRRECNEDALVCALAFWRKMTPAERDKCRLAVKEVSTLLGHNPYGLYPRFLLALGIHAPWAFPSFFFVLRAVRYLKRRCNRWMGR